MDRARAHLRSQRRELDSSSSLQNPTRRPGWGAGPRGAPALETAGRGVTATATSRIGKGTESPNRLSSRLRGVEARGAEEELPKPRGMTSSSAWESQALKIRALVRLGVLTPGVRRDAAPRSRCDSGAMRPEAISARLN